MLVSSANRTKGRLAANTNMVVETKSVARRGVFRLALTFPNHAGSSDSFAIPYNTLALIIICTKIPLIIAIAAKSEIACPLRPVTCSNNDDMGA